MEAKRTSYIVRLQGIIQAFNDVNESCGQFLSVGA